MENIARKPARSFPCHNVLKGVGSQLGCSWIVSRARGDEDDERRLIASVPLRKRRGHSSAPSLDKDEPWSRYCKKICIL
ncbi:jg21644 [Pararge aegeria aegeria]|uniref:Jg21644 protein n=1 Tax=Pararge aegeria aegeria TaxID=348720 RepID=A0A8S4QZ02_9NEOP|nr:jg21644 [Pararge aegeria aegeria]